MSRPVRLQISLGVFLVAFVTLMVELMLIRVFDVVLVSNLGYMVISCALFAFGLAGVYATLRPLTDPARLESYLAWLCVALAAACFLQLPLLNANPFNLKFVVENPALQLFYFLLIYLTVILPFFFAGLILATVFSVYAAQIRKLYFFDLVGAAIGAVINVPLIRPLGPGGLMFLAAALALLAAALFRGRIRFAVIAVAAGAACVALPLSRSGYYEFKPHIDKRGVLEALEDGAVERTVWDPVSRVDVVPAAADPSVPDRVPAKFIRYDGGTQSTTLFAFDGDFAALRRELDQSVDHAPRHFWNRAVPAAHWLKADTSAEVLIIGSAGGQETKAALTYGASRVDAIEMVEAVVDLVTGPYADYIGGLFQDPRVHVTVGEGRTFLRGTDRTYDIIQIFSNYTSSSISAGNGAATTNYLQTADAYVEYFTHLKPNGVIQINHNIYPRLITTAALAWQWLGRTDFRSHVVVYERERETLPTILIKMSPWTAAELARLDAHMLAPNPGNEYLLMENPLDPAASFLSDAFYDRPEAVELGDLDFVVRPATDDRPYFNFIRRSLDRLDPASSRFLDQGTAAALNSQLKAGVPSDLVHFFVTATAGLLFACVFVFVPLLLSSAGRSRWPNMLTAMFYFSCLGAGFIIIELTLIQIFIKLIGFPLYAYSAVIFTMLLAAGLGSLSADRLDIHPTRRWQLPFVGLLACGAVLWLVHPLVFDHALGLPIALRILIGAAMIFPMGFFMGMPLPLGILTLADQPRGAVAWAWAMNGLFTVIGGLIAAIGSIYLGFKVVLLIGFAIYVAAGLAFLRLHRTPAGAAFAPRARAVSS